MKTTTIVVATGFIALTVLVVLLHVYRAQKERARQARISQWAASHGWTVTLRPRALEWCNQLPGHDRRGVSLILSGNVSGWPVSVADYSYVTTSSTGPDGATTRTRHRFIVTAVRLPGPYKPIAVQSRKGLSRVGRAIFGDGAAATGNEGFDRRFRVQTKDPATSRALIGPTLISEHLAERIPEWNLAGQNLLTWQSGKIEDPSCIQPLADRLVYVATLFGH
jgi:hypothetical protein